MIPRFGSKAAAAALAAVLALSAPIHAFAEPVITGTADIPDENMIMTGTRDLPEYGLDDPYFGLADDAMLMGISDTPEDVDQALRNVLQYLDSMSGNLIVGTEGGEWSAIALARNGVLSDSARETYLKNLMATLDELGGNLSKAKMTEYARVILCLGALGLDPYNMGGYDLVQPLANFKKVTIQGINGPIWTLIALDSANYEVPTLPEGEKGEQTSREGIITYLLENQYPGGGWSFSGQGLDDMNMMAVQALTPYYHQRADVKAAVDLAIRNWSALQNDKGGFGDSGDTGNGGVEAICQTIIALSGLDVSLVDGELFTKNGSSLLNALLTYQAPDGSFRHTLDGDPGNAIATDQAALALTAYVRALRGQTRVYDMTDVAQSGGGPASEEEVEAFRQELYAVPIHPNLDHREVLNSLQARLSQLGSFPEKEEFSAQIAELKQEIAPQEAEIKAWDEAMTEIVPAKLTLKDKKAVEDLRSRYNALPIPNRKYLQYASDLLLLEEKLLQLDNEGFPILGEAKAPANSGNGSSGSGSSSGGSRRPSGTGTRVTTTVESNTTEVKARDGVVSGSELEKIKGQDKNLRMLDRLENGRDYTVTVHGKDLDRAEDVNIGIRLTSQFREEMEILGENPYIFHLDQKGYFPAAMLVELPVELDDGLYMLLRYNEAERRAEYVAKPEVKEGKAAFTVEQGGDYFLAKKAISKSLDELEAPTVPPTQAPAVTEAIPTASAVPEEIPTGTPVGLIAGIVAGALILAGGIVTAVVLLNRRKVKL